MLIVVMGIAFLASHLVLQAAITEIAGRASDSATLVIIVAYTLFFLALSGVCGRLIAPWRRTMISVAYGGIFATFFSWAAIVRAGLSRSPLPNPEAYGVILIVFFLLWGGGTHTAIALVFGTDARDEYWRYIKTNYSTFRKN
jgi:hypothetical protein